MHRRLRHLSLAAFVTVATFVAGCSGSKSGGDASASAAPSASASVSAPAATVTDVPTGPDANGSGAPAASDLASPAAPASDASPSPTPTPTPNLNLLDSQNGSLVRVYPPGLTADPASVSSEGASFDETSTGPFVFVFELPGVATIASFEVKMSETATGTTGHAQVAISSASATGGFTDVGSAQAISTDETDLTLPANQPARWVRVTLDQGAKTVFRGIKAFGTLQPRPATAPRPEGVFVEANPYAGKPPGFFVPDPGTSADPWYVRFKLADAGIGEPEGMSGIRCYDSALGDPYPGSVDGRVWNWSNSSGRGTFVINDEATVISNSDKYFVRTDRVPKLCHVIDAGGPGAVRVLVLDRSDYELYPVGASLPPTAYHFDRDSPAMLDAVELSKYSILMINGVCNTGDFFSPAAAKALTDWIAAGHKLMIYDADMCGKDTEYKFLPYQFTTNNPGANGAKGDRLIEVENDQLGSLESGDTAHYFDPKPFASGSNQLGDANTVTSHDTHWCGHLFGTNVNKVNGFMQMYAPFGKGLIIYSGLDHDDDPNPYFERLRQLELAASIDGNLPCTQSVSLAFLIEPSQQAKFTPGKRITMHFPMELLANQGWKGHATLTTSGDFAGGVTPGGLDVDGGTTPLSVAVDIPANAKPGTYAVLVTGTGSDGQTAQATIQFQASTPIVKQLKLQRRIRLYGIHFDVDSANIQPRSEPVIKEVAEIMREEPSWRFRIEGHTDSDGGEAHNQVLSQHRAQSVIDDLVKRYHVARGRLVPAGYGLSRPVASNATAAGKALNRRVELVRL